MYAPLYIGCMPQLYIGCMPRSISAVCPRSISAVYPRSISAVCPALYRMYAPALYRLYTPSSISAVCPALYRLYTPLYIGCLQVSELMLAELQSFDAGQGNRIPTLVEVLELLERSPMSLMIEVKAGGIAAIERLAATVGQTAFAAMSMRMSIHMAYTCVCTCLYVCQHSWTKRHSPPLD